jgi:probable HAF family extracellular repeat protein
MNRSRSTAAWITAAAVAGLIGACGGGAPSEIDVLVTPATLQITVGDSALLRAEVRGAGDRKGAVTWSSGDAAVATVDAAGMVTGVALGEAVITATSIDHPAAHGSATVTVVERPVETGTLRPGTFTVFGGGLLIGTHPQAIADPITVEVAWFQPPHDSAEPRRDRFLEIRLLDLPPGEELLATPDGTGFFVAVPVPEDFELERLAPFEYVYTAFGASYGATDLWLWTGGIFDPSYRAFVFELDDLGGAAYPTRLGIVEHDAPQPLEVDDIIDRIADELFGPAATGTAQATVHPSAQDTFFKIWQRCPGTCDAGVVREVASAFGVGLDPIQVTPGDEDLALNVYLGLNHGPRPRLKTTDKLRRGTTYVYYVYSDQATLPLTYQVAMDSNPCPAGVSGTYVRYGRRAWTCEHATHPVATTRHELFHAMQWWYPVYSPTSGYELIAEGTARLAQGHTDPLGLSGFESPPPVTEHLVEFRPYAGEFFFHHLFHSSNLEFRHLGDLFDIGLRQRHLEQYVRDHTPYLDLGEAYWEWVKDMIFEAKIDQSVAYVDSGSFTTEPCLLGDYRTLITIPVERFAPGEVVERELEGLTAEVVRLEFPTGAEPYRATVTFASDDPRMRAKFYPVYDAATEACWELPEAGAHSVEVFDERVLLHALVSNTNVEEPGGDEAPYTLTFGDHETLPVPTANDDDAAVLPWSSSVTIDVLANDSDPLGSGLDIVGLSDPLHGTVQLLPDDRVRYVVTGAFAGTDAFEYTIENASGYRDSATVTVSVSARLQDVPLVDPPGTVVNEERLPRVNRWRDRILTRTLFDELRAYLEFGDGRLIDLTELAGAPTIATDLNDHPQVVGAVLRDDDIDAFIWDTAGGFRLLPNPFGGSTMAMGIDDSGRIVGRAQFEGFLAPQAAVWDEESLHRMDLGLSADFFSIATGISDDGWIAGYYRDTRTVAVFPTQAFAWHDGQVIPLGALGGESSVALDVGVGGRVIGAAQNAAGAWRAFLWLDGEMTDLGALGGTESRALALNAHGQIVGEAMTAADGMRGFVWQDDTLVDVNDHLPPDSDLTVTAVTGINDSGHMIAIAVDGSGNQRAVLIIPEP